MDRKDIADTLHDGERVTSIYAETYLNDDYCDYEKPDHETTVTTKEQPDTTADDFINTDDWKSPSDLLIGIVDLIPPFTSKISRGITHEGILAIGNDVLVRERTRFLEYIKQLMAENDAAWSHILEHEKNMVAQKVKEVYRKILEDKSKILMQEINIFYENTLQELEDYLRKEVAGVLMSAHANVMSDLNQEIKDKLEYEKKVLTNVLKQRYENEVKKIKHYYNLLLENEEYRNNKLINHALQERNDAIKAFCRQIEAETMTSTMYVMCTERKRCRIKQFILDNYHSTEIADKLQKIKERQDIIDAFKERDKHISVINQEWQEKIKKILTLFLKFISFSLKLLPEQTTFLLDLEKMVVLQLNEMQKTPMKSSSILVDEEKLNTFKFESAEPEEPVCDKDPFVVVGDTSIEENKSPYGSRETIPSNVEIPMIRVQRQFIYAKCDKFEEVRDLLEARRCKCMDQQKSKPPSPPKTDESSVSSTNKPPTPVDSSSSNEPLLVDDIEILKSCPARNCQDHARRYSFPYINDYIDFTEDNYRRVTAILGNLPKDRERPELINPREIVWQELPFAETHEKYHNVGTQYSSQEDVTVLPRCECADVFKDELIQPEISIKESMSAQIKEIMLKRKASLKQVISDNPNLLKMFTDESFDFVYTVT